VTDPIRRTLDAAQHDDYRDRRRSQRVQLAIPVLVRARMRGAEFEESTGTVSVSANGCLVWLRRQVERGQELHLVNPQTVEELPCRVVYIGPREKGRAEVGLEFIEASPLFWRIAFPPTDWDPKERKLPAGKEVNTKAS
jgi:PilZ domain